MTFREWLHNYINNDQMVDPFDALSKYDELEPQPKFKVGEKVIFCKKEYEIGNTHIRYSLKNSPYDSVEESLLDPAPKKKLVFSLEKWVEKRMKTNGAKYVIENIDEMRDCDGMTGHEVELARPYNFVFEPDLFVEVDE